jgi:hypothetical protein
MEGRWRRDVMTAKLRRQPWAARQLLLRLVFLRLFLRPARVCCPTLVAVGLPNLGARIVAAMTFAPGARPVANRGIAVWAAAGHSIR